MAAPAPAPQPRPAPTRAAPPPARSALAGAGPGDRRALLAAGDGAVLATSWLVAGGAALGAGPAVAWAGLGFAALAAQDQYALRPARTRALACAVGAGLAGALGMSALAALAAPGGTAALAGLAAPATLAGAGAGAAPPLLAAMLALVGLPAVRRTCEARLVGPMACRRALVVGNDQAEIHAAVAALAAHPAAGLRVVGAATDLGWLPPRPPVLVHGPMRALPAIVARVRPDVVIAGASVLRCRHLAALPPDITVLDLAGLLGRLEGRAPAGVVDDRWAIEVGAARPGGLARAGRRVAEVAIAAPLAVAAAPVVLAAALALRLTGAGPVFVADHVVGRRGRPIRRWRLAARGPVGRAMAAARLAGLPALWNVLRGDLALVGPTPVAPAAAPARADPVRAARLAAPPGLTGWAQVRATDAERADGEAMLAYDLYYLRHRSLTFDLAILGRAALGPWIALGR